MQEDRRVTNTLLTLCCLDNVWLFATRVCACRVSESHVYLTACYSMYIHILYIHPALLRLAARLAYMALCMQSLLRDAGVCVSSL